MSNQLDGPPTKAGHPAKTRDDLITLLSRSLGEDAARLYVVEAAGDLRLGDQLAVADALAILEKLAGSPGLVGVAARFAKARVHLAWLA